MVELFDADLKRKGFDGVALPAGSYELHKINGVRLDINKSLDELGVQDGDTLVLVPRVAGESFEPQYESLSTTAVTTAVCHRLRVATPIVIAPRTTTTSPISA